MAAINLVVTPQYQSLAYPTATAVGVGQVMRFHTDDGTRYAPVKLSIPAGQTYAQADQCVLVYPGGSDFFTHFGARFIHHVICELIETDNVSFGLLKLFFQQASQKASLRKEGNGGAGGVTGPQNDVQLADGTALGNNAMTCNAVIFW